jgi:hypothetical protein
VYGPFWWFCWDLLLFVISQTREATTPILLQVLDWIPEWDFNPILQFKLQMLQDSLGGPTTKLEIVLQLLGLKLLPKPWNCTGNLRGTSNQLNYLQYFTCIKVTSFFGRQLKKKNLLWNILYCKILQPCFLESWWYIGKLEICRSVWTTTTQLQNISHVSNLHFSFFSKRLLWSGIYKKQLPANPAARFPERCHTVYIPTQCTYVSFWVSCHLIVYKKNIALHLQDGVS